MAIELDMRSADFERRFEALLGAKRESASEVDEAVAAIIDDVRARGDEALADYSRRFDRVDIAAKGLRIGASEIEAATGACEPKALKALELAHRRVTDYHQRQKPADVRFVDALGVELGWRWRPIEAVGLYVPGGAASYPSSVVMNAAPAKVAGCARIAMVVPTPDGAVNPLVLAAARIAGVDEIYRVGGAQAIAALAYGTQSIPRVDKIFGPGNAWVTAAKQLVANDPLGAACDLPAGPSEVLVIADATARADFVAADLLAQAEHDPLAQALLVTDSRELAVHVAQALNSALPRLTRRSILEQSLAACRCILVPDLTTALAVANEYAPEHLLLQVREPRHWLTRVRNAGAVFLGSWSPEPLGDYCTGANHVLPTGGYARALSGLSVRDFLKTITVQELSPAGLSALGPTAVTLALLEGLDAHAQAVTRRLGALAAALS